MLFIYLRGVVRGCEYILRQNHKDIFLRLEDSPTPRVPLKHTNEAGAKKLEFSTEKYI